MTLREHPERVVGRIEMAWAEGKLSTIADMIDEAAVLVPREGGPSFCGRGPFLVGFRRTADFTFERVEPGGFWQAWDATAVFHRPISGVAGASSSSVRAREVWVLTRRDALWSVVCHSTA